MSRQGPPMVALPVTNDQPGVAARIAYRKIGAYVPIQGMTASQLSALIDEVLNNNPEYHQNANNMKQVIAETNGLKKSGRSTRTGLQPRLATAKELRQSIKAFSKTPSR